LKPRELWLSRELLLFLAQRDVKARYKQAFFGIGWSIVQPLVGVVVLAVVFQRLANVPSEGIPYPVFALVGYVVWTYFSGSVGAATASLVSNASLVTKVYFPRLIAPLATLLPGLIGFGIGLCLVAMLMGIYGIAPTIATLAVPLCILGLIVVVLGPGLMFAALNVKYRDVGPLLAVLMQLWLFASPVAYPSSLVHGAWQYVYALNPVVGVIDTFRWSLLNAPAPGLPLIVSVATALALLGLGLWIFQRADRDFADVI
jgi:ABC-type polysaccharide/polyol phosphate export permease